MTEARTNEVARAQANPGIISQLSGASAPAPTSAPAPAPTSAPAASTQMPTVAGLPGLPPGAVEAAQGLSDKLHGTGFISGGEQAQADVMKQLFEYDQMLEKGYSPYPEKDFYVENPNDLYGGAAAYAKGMGQISGQQGQVISNTERAYETAVGGLLDRFIDFFKLQKAEEKDKEERTYRQKKDQFDMEMQIAKLTGGTVTNPFTGEKMNIPAGAGGGGGGGTATEREQSRVTEQIKADSKKGIPIEDLIRRYGDVANYADILGAYDATSPYGEAKRGDEVYRAIYNQVTKSGGSAQEAEDEAARMADTADTWTDFRSQVSDDDGRYDAAKAEEMLSRDQEVMKARGIDVDTLWKWHNDEKARQAEVTNPQASDGEKGWFQSMINTIAPQSPAKDGESEEQRQQRERAMMAGGFRRG